MLLFGIILSSLAFSTSSHTSTEALAPGRDYWDQHAVTDWYDEKFTNFYIFTEEQFAGFAKLVNNGNTFENKRITLKCELNLEAYDWVPIGLGDISDAANKEINVFKGYFDGENHEISHMMIGDKDHPEKTKKAALFGSIDGAILDHVNVGNSCHVYTTANRAAGICANVRNSMLICCSNAATVHTTGFYAGGIAAFAIGPKIRMSFCSNKGKITSKHYASGIVSFSDKAKLELHKCANYEEVTTLSNGAISRAGGICSIGSERVEITECTNDGKVSAVTSAGICSYAIGITNVENCKNNGEITSRPNFGDTLSIAGGIVAYFVGDNLSINGCTNDNIACVIYTRNTSMAGGICGADFGREARISNCINNFRASVDSTFICKVGGIVGYIMYPKNSKIINNKYRSGYVFKRGVAVNLGIGNTKDQSGTEAI